MGKKRHKPDHLARKKPYREPRKRFLVVCGGRVTEPGYLEGVRQAYRDRLIKIEIVPESRAPVGVVAQAIRLNDEENARAKEDFDRYDEVWCVFDKDDFDLSESVLLANANGISLAVSNPCFELWLVLHFQDQMSHISTANTRRLCQRYLPNYDKHVNFDQLWAHVQQATTRALELDRMHSRNGRNRANPSTGFHLLVQQIELSQLRRAR